MGREESLDILHKNLAAAVPLLEKEGTVTANTIPGYEKQRTSLGERSRRFSRNLRGASSSPPRVLSGIM